MESVTLWRGAVYRRREPMHVGPLACPVCGIPPGAPRPRLAMTISVTSAPLAAARIASTGSPSTTELETTSPRACSAATWPARYGVRAPLPGRLLHNRVLLHLGWAQPCVTDGQTGLRFDNGQQS